MSNGKSSERINAESLVLQSGGTFLPLPATGLDLPWVDFTACEQSGIKPDIIVALAFQSNGQAGLAIVKGGDEMTATMLIQSSSEDVPYSLSLSLQNSFGSKLVHIMSRQYGSTFYFPNGQYMLVSIRFTIPHLMNGHYSLSAGILSQKNENWETQHFIHDVLFFEMHTNDARYHTNAPIVVQEVHFMQKEI
jgi:hypothetical protein